ncbi:MAG: glycosyltransferase family 4 protein [Balneolaceae bacterium]|nr:glycosyltransferase family 4 protein [Balneolaceae bacterium]
MNILQVHNRYKYKGGEWTVVSQEYDLLGKEHVVEQYIVNNREALKSILSKAKLVFKTHYNRESKKDIGEKLNHFKADVMHVHNFFPLLSPSIFEAAREAGIPSVLTLHNYRLIHPNGLMYYNGEIDNRSVNGSAYRCVFDGVYRNSIFQTAVLAHMIEYHRKNKTWQKFPSAFIALSEFSKQMFVEGGLPEERILVKPNFLKDPISEHTDLKLSSQKEDIFLYVGRISYEKGVQDLINFWLENKISSKLILAGDGPLREKLVKQSEGHSGIEWLGQLSRKNILSKLAVAKALIFPTKWYEGQPLILLEALSMGCPVITSKIGNPQQIISHGKTGFHFSPGNFKELQGCLDVINSEPQKVIELSVNARKQFLEKYTPEKNYHRILEIYSRATEFEKNLNGEHGN